jgi:hypothetical protein
MEEGKKKEAGETLPLQIKSYSPPSLVKYGSVEKLTGTGGSENLVDSSTSMRMPPCL